MNRWEWLNGFLQFVATILGVIAALLKIWKSYTSRHKHKCKKKKDRH